MVEASELTMLRDSVRRLSEETQQAHWSSAARTGRSDHALWTRIANDGWLTAGLPAERGGFGFGVAEAAVIAEETGRALLTEPVIANLVALTLVAAVADAELSDSVIDAVASGRQRLALAIHEPGGGDEWREPETRLRRDGDATLLDGTKAMVLGGGDADLLLTVARDEAGELCVLLVPAAAAGVALKAYPLVDGTGAADVAFTKVSLSQEALLARGATADAAIAGALDLGAVLTSARGLGAMRAAFDRTLDYVKQRVQFGEAIGRNQALQHRLVDCLRLIREAEILLDGALAAFDGPADARALAVSALKAHLGPAMRTIGQEAVQLHGAIGTTDEAAISHYFKALVALGPQFGDADWHRARFAALSELAGADASTVTLTPEDQAFVDELRAFIAAELDPAARDVIAAGGHLTKAQSKAWELALAKRNWLVYTWTEAQGGPGFTPMQQFLFEQTLAECHAPGNNGLAIKMAGPVIREFGTPAQKAQHLPGIIGGTVNWCQGYSEPGAGSDLAALTTRAELDGDDYIVNGQKIWTSYAHWADWMFMLVRTSREAKRQAGITFLLVDMKTPGIVVRPILSSDGHHGFNEVFFEDVRVPQANRIGEEGKGWTYAKFLLNHERLGVVSLPSIKHSLARVEEAVAMPDRSGRRRGDDPLVAARLADLKIRLRALEGWVQRSLAQVLEGGSPGLEVSMIKIRGTELNQELAAFTMDMLGEAALPFAFDQGGASPTRGIAPTPAFGRNATATYLYRRAFTILGGSTEVQKNIVSKAVLGL